MALFQEILVYIIVLLAIAYIVKKFILPRSLSTSKKDSTKACGKNDCGCH